MKSLKKILMLLLLNGFFMNAQNDRTDFQDAFSPYFDNAAIGVITGMIRTFEKALCNNDSLEMENYIGCWIDFLQNNQNPQNSNDFDIPISMDKQLELFADLGSIAFDRIWEIRNVEDKKTLENSQKLVMLTNSHYVDFLKMLGADYRLIDQYVKTLLTSGDLSATLIVSVANDFEELDVKDPRIKLFLCTHYLTINYNLKRHYCVGDNH